MILQCPQCGEQYEISANRDINRFTMNCTKCGHTITMEDEIKVTPLHVIEKPIYDEEEEEGKKSSWWKWAAGIMLILLLALFFTRPAKARHDEKIHEIVMAVLSKSIESENSLTQDLALLLGPFVIDRAIDLMVQIDDYYFFNIGRIKYDDVDKPITIGIFNNVIPLTSKEELIKRLDEVKLDK